MDKGLFTKHIRALTSQQTDKQNVLNLIAETTGITLTGEEVNLSKKKVTIITSSAVKAILTQKNLQTHLTTAGYTLSF